MLGNLVNYLSSLSGKHCIIQEEIYSKNTVRNLTSTSYAFLVTCRKMFLKTTLSLSSPPRVQAGRLASKVVEKTDMRIHSIFHFYQ